MTDRPIIFSAPMVRALLDGRKTQTRRVIKAAPPEATSAGTYYSSETGHSNVCTWLSGDPSDCDTWGVLDDFRLPYAPGDRLYVREAIDKASDRDGVFYRADYEAQHGDATGLGWRPSIHMRAAMPAVVASHARPMR